MGKTFIYDEYRKKLLKTTIIPISTPKKFTFPFQSPVKKLFCGEYAVFALCENKKIYVWGKNKYGNFGTNTPFSVERNLNYQPILAHKYEIWDLSEENFFKNCDSSLFNIMTRNTLNLMTWKQIKILFVAFYKREQQPKNLCHISKLPRELIKYIYEQ